MMNQAEPGCVEFLDLSGIEESERNWILSSLHSWNPNIQLPWELGCELSYLKQQKHVSGNYCASPSLVMTASINLHEPLQPALYTQAYELPSYVPQGPPINSSMYLGPTYPHTQPEAAASLQTTFVVNNNINYNIGHDSSSAYINTKLEITQGFANTTISNLQQVNGDYNNGLSPDSGPHSASQEYLMNHTVHHSLPAQSQGDLSVQMDHNRESNAYLSDPHSSPDTSLSEMIPNYAQERTPPPAKSWASLFNKNSTVEPAKNLTRQQSAPSKPSALVPPFMSNTIDTKPSSTSPLLLKEPFLSNADDPNLHRMGECLAVHVIDNRITSLQPRGLINRSNYCYINSILQAILACPPFYNLINNLADNTSPVLERKRITPTIDSMVRFVQEFHHLPSGMRVGRRLDKNQKKEHTVLINCDTPFEPFWIHKLLSGMRSDTFVVEGRQEDAEEFLGCLLNGLNDEMLELMKLAGNHQECNEPCQDHIPNQDEDKEWQVMGPKNKGAITRRTDFGRTPISDIFGGSLRSRLHRSGDQSTDNIQPFFTLQLNIEKANSVREALEMLVCKNQLEGVTSSKTNEEVEAWQQVTLEELPIVLVLHLKCFDYMPNGCSKIIKTLDFPIDLKIDTKLLSSKTNYSTKEKQYKLFAVVYHEGKEATKGHYITDTYHVGYASWLRFDDASVKAVSEEHVLKPQNTRVPYLLFYRRCDSLSRGK